PPRRTLVNGSPPRTINNARGGAAAPPPWHHTTSGRGTGADERGRALARPAAAPGLGARAADGPRRLLPAGGPAGGAVGFPGGLPVGGRPVGLAGPARRRPLDADGVRRGGAGHGGRDPAAPGV